jgi:hypothetical protein
MHDAGSEIVDRRINKEPFVPMSSEVNAQHAIDEKEQVEAAGDGDINDSIFGQHTVTDFYIAHDWT